MWFISCFAGRWAENIFFQIPIVLLLLVNTIFFTLTIMKIRKLTRETAVLNRADSMIHNKATEEQHRYFFKSIAQFFQSHGKYLQAYSVREAVPVDGRNVADRQFVLVYRRTGIDLDFYSVDQLLQRCFNFLPVRLEQQKSAKLSNELHQCQIHFLFWPQQGWIFGTLGRGAFAK